MPTHAGPRSGQISPGTSRRAGFALPGVLLVLLAASLIAVFTLRSGKDELRAAVATFESARAFYAAEAGLSTVVAAWDSLQYDTLMTTPGDSLVLPWATLGNGARYQAWMRRIDGGGTPRYYTLGVTAVGDGSVGGRRTAFMEVRTDFPDICCDATIKGGLGGGDVRLDEIGNGGVTATGMDTTPPLWDDVCSANYDDKPAVQWKTNDVDIRDGALVTGNPPVERDGTISSSNLFDWGWLDYNDLKAMADITFADGTDIGGGIGPSVVGTECDTGAKKNWGAPASPGHPCFDYFPIIHVKGDLRIRDGVGIGQGILLVDGELRIEDSFTFYGIIVAAAKDAQRTRFEDNMTLYGGLISGDEVRVEDGSDVWLSQCAADRAMAGRRLFKVVPLARRAWRQGWR